MRPFYIYCYSNHYTHTLHFSMKIGNLKMHFSINSEGL